MPTTITSRMPYARPAERERLPVATNIWHCHPNAIHCQRNDHLMAFYKAGYRMDFHDHSGHSFAECLLCDPPQYFFTLFSALPSPMVTCYELSKESYGEWAFSSRRTPATPELLYLLRDPEGRSFNPYWLPAR